MKHIRHLIIQQKKNADGGSVETVSSAVITALYNMSKDEQLVYNSTDLKGDLHCAVCSAKQVNYLMTQYPDLSIEADTYTVDFEDPEVENICVTNWGSNGSITLSQLQTVTSVGTVFKGNTNIVKFNEFQNFTGLTVQYTNYNQQTFSGCTNLKEIVLPSNTSCIGSQMFQNCSSLESLTIPNSVKEVGNQAFKGCSSIQSLVFTGLTGQLILESMNSLTSLTINEGCTSLEVGDLASLEQIDVPASVQRIRVRNCSGVKIINFAPNSRLTGFAGSDGAFWRTANLTTINNFPTTYTSTQASAFEGCINLVTMIPLPNGCTSVPRACYCDCNSMAGEFIIPATVTSIGEYAFRNTNSFTGIRIYATTPPTINVLQFGHLFSNASSNNNPAVGYPIYVPQSALADYQADTNWSKFGSRLQGFTE